MAQYLDKEVLVEKIEKRKKQNVLTNEGAFEEDVDILSFIDTLEVKEVNFESELSKYVSNGIHRFFPNEGDDYYNMIVLYGKTMLLRLPNISLNLDFL